MTPEQRAVYDSFTVRRAMRPLLSKGMRYLTPDDRWQLGDEYDGAGDGKSWWVIGSKYTSVKAGTLVDVGWLCYTPRGSVKREKI